MSVSLFRCRCAVAVRWLFPISSVPRRSFSKRLGSGGFGGGGERRSQTSTKRKQSGTADDTGAAAGSANSGGTTAGSTGSAGGQQQRGGGGGGDSIAALEAESEERLSPFLLPLITARPPADVRPSEQRVAEWQYEAAMQRRLRAKFIRDNVRLSGKLRRRWEALNGLTDELRRICLLEDRTPLPASLRIPLQANGQPLLPTTPGLAGAEPWTERELKQHLDWQQKQKERGLPY